MIKQKKLSIDEAKKERTEIIATCRNQTKDLRRLLAKAKLSKGYDVLGFTSFELYLNDIILKHKLDISPDYARKCANAGLVEIVLLGEEAIGTMREAPLRVFYENIDEKLWKKVFALAKKDSRKPMLYRRLTAKQIINAAKKIDVYSRINGKTKPKNAEKYENIINKTGNKSVSDEDSLNTNNNDESNKHKAKNNKRNTTNDDEIVPEKSLVINKQPNAIKPNQDKPIKSLSSNKAKEKIIDNYKPDEIDNIIGYLKVSQDINIKNRCIYIVNNCNKKAMGNLIEKLSTYVAK
jgi:hypothetical protein